MIEKLKLPAASLTPGVAAERLGFSDTSELSPFEEPIGQERAVEVLEFGLRMQSAEIAGERDPGVPRSRARPGSRGRAAHERDGPPSHQKPADRPVRNAAACV